MLTELNIDKSWSLFLDRDGVINVRLVDDYVKNLSEWKFEKGSADAIVNLSKVFGRTFIVTNQQGINKGIMSHHDVELVHNHLISEVFNRGGKINAIYYAPFLASENSEMRKPNTGMALQAKNDFPEIDFSKSIMVGDSESDIEFGKRLGMKTVYISEKLENTVLADFIFKSLLDFSKSI